MSIGGNAASSTCMGVYRHRGDSRAGNGINAATLCLLIDCTSRHLLIEVLGQGEPRYQSRQQLLFKEPIYVKM